MSTTDAAAFWDGVHAARPAAAPRPNARLAETVTGLPPGDALDLGCGIGGDALWLADQGWRVTATDISAVAVERLAALALAGGLGDRVAAVRHDLHRSLPPGGFDLICAHYLHTPFDLDRASVLRAAAHALRPGGRLLVVDDGSTAPWSWDQDPGVRYPGPEEVAGELGLDAATWTVERADSPTRTATGPDGRTAEVTDHVLLIRRGRPAAARRRRDTPPPRTGSGEAEVLRGFLDYLRTSIAAKVEGAAEPQARTARVPSGTNLLGLLNHLVSVERALFLGEDVTDWQATFQADPADGVADVVARYRAAVERANDVLDGCADLGAPIPGTRPGRPAPSVRWALTHMIEETGRHAGHVDILRELIDGTTGR
ncbi:DUF664 domain-containing protein [Nonomuraea longicatena]|uniref:Methyltransferase domain-containing protein n=1 Tax=Nonomuraea longicatena TaxID=83682 RepID=A0ABP4AV78_9ACTN